MNIIKRLCLTIVVALTMDAAIITPAFVQQRDLAALTAKISALFRAGKFAEAVPLAQQALAIGSRSLRPDDPNLAALLNNLAALYD
jgi:Flp pilus assembly protein TadD